MKEDHSYPSVKQRHLFIETTHGSVAIRPFAPSTDPREQCQQPKSTLKLPKVEKNTHESFKILQNYVINYQPKGENMGDFFNPTKKDLFVEKDAKF